MKNIIPPLKWYPYTGFYHYGSFWIKPAFKKLGTELLFLSIDNSVGKISKASINESTEKTDKSKSMVASKHLIESTSCNK